MKILAIESSCDETAVAVVEDSRILANVIASQTRIHQVYQGVVPELASRCHIEYILPVLEEALQMAKCAPESLDGLAVTRGPGLIGSLLVGVETAKALALSWKLPLTPVHHTMGHVHAIFCHLPGGQSRLLEIAPEKEEATFAQAGSEADSPASRFTYPFLSLVVSGGHSHLLRVDAPDTMTVVGYTLDDAPGEAYDKVAKCLGLPYPGGPAIDRLAPEGNPKAYALPRPVLHAPHNHFSFSGLKTAVVRVIEEAGGVKVFRDSPERLADLCASFQAAAVDVLLGKTEKVMKKEKLKRLAVVGGVACNRGLRSAAAERLGDSHLVFPPPILCTDNAAMIARAAMHLSPLSQGEMAALDARSGWTLPERD